MYRARRLFTSLFFHAIIITCSSIRIRTDENEETETTPEPPPVETKDNKNKTTTPEPQNEENETTTPEPLTISKLSYNEWCKFQPNTFDCGEKRKSALNRYYFDLKMDDCIKTFSGDCKDNYNIFSNIHQCRESCREPSTQLVASNLTMNVICRFQQDFGACHDYEPSWYFDVSTKTCKGFSYSGCGGNKNRFKSNNDCTSECLPHVEYEVNGH